MSTPPAVKDAPRRAALLDDAIRVFGQYGFRKASVQDLADAAGISKPGLYLHFPSKEAIFTAAMEKYLAEALVQVRTVLSKPGVPLQERLASAIDAWFGQHLVTFMPAAFDVIAEGDYLTPEAIEAVKVELRGALADAFIAAGFSPAQAAGRAQVLFLCGLSWKQPGMTPELFRSAMQPCVQVCCEPPFSINSDAR